MVVCLPSHLAPLAFFTLWWMDVVVWLLSHLALLHMNDFCRICAFVSGEYPLQNVSIFLLVTVRNPPACILLADDVSSYLPDPSFRAGGIRAHFCRSSCRVPSSRIFPIGFLLPRYLTLSRRQLCYAFSAAVASPATASCCPIGLLKVDSA